MTDEINEDATSAAIILTFEHDGIEGTITRRFYRLTASRALLSWNGEDIKGVKDVNNFVAELTGSTSEMIEKFSFVGQDALRAVLFDTPKKRMEYLISMVPSIARSKTYRARVEDFLRTIPVIVPPYDKEHVEAEKERYTEFLTTNKEALTSKDE